MLMPISILLRVAKPAPSRVPALHKSSIYLFACSGATSSNYMASHDICSSIEFESFRLSQRVLVDCWNGIYWIPMYSNGMDSKNPTCASAAWPNNTEFLLYIDRHFVGISSSKNQYQSSTSPPNFKQSSVFNHLLLRDTLQSAFWFSFPFPGAKLSSRSEERSIGTSTRFFLQITKNKEKWCNTVPYRTGTAAQIKQEIGNK